MWTTLQLIAESLVGLCFRENWKGFGSDPLNADGGLDLLHYVWTKLNCFHGGVGRFNTTGGPREVKQMIKTLIVEQ